MSPMVSRGRVFCSIMIASFLSRPLFLGRKGDREASSSVLSSDLSCCIHQDWSGSGRGENLGRVEAVSTTSHPEACQVPQHNINVYGWAFSRSTHTRI